MVVFRLTQEEYSRLQNACSAQGGRNVSDFTRSELLARIENEDSGESLEKRLHAVEQQLLAVQCTVQDLLGAVDERGVDPDRLAHPMPGDAVMGSEG
jgi:hypothetical protein